MGFNRFVPAFAVAAVVVMAAGAVSAHARLVSSTPAANATVAAPRSIALTYSERMVPAFSTFEVVNAAIFRVAMGALHEFGPDRKCSLGSVEGKFLVVVESDPDDA